MRTKLWTAVLAGVLGAVGALAAPQAVSAQAAGCCIVRGDGPWFSGPTQVADCNAYGTAALNFWDGYHCTAGTGARAGQTHVTFWLIIS